MTIEHTKIEQPKIEQANQVVAADDPVAQLAVGLQRGKRIDVPTLPTSAADASLLNTLKAAGKS
jgi:hypothetical protein